MVFSNGMRCESFMLVVSLVLFFCFGLVLIKLGTEKLHKGQRVHSADLGNRIWYQRCKISKYKITYRGGGGVSQLTNSKKPTLLTVWEQERPKAKDGKQCNQISSKILRSKTLKLTALNKHLNVTWFVKILLLNPSRKCSITLQRWRQWLPSVLTPLICTTPG